MLIRSFVPRDLPVLLDLTIATFGPFYEDHFRPLVGEVVFANQHGDWRGDYRRLLDGLHDPAGNKHVAVAEIDGIIAGYAGWAADPAARSGEVEIIAVDAAHRRHGVAAALCEHAFAGMRDLGAEMVAIHTGGDAFHTPARAFYESLGCVPFPTAVYYREL